jgi:hypothetical protein
LADADSKRSCDLFKAVFHYHYTKCSRCGP